MSKTTIWLNHDGKDIIHMEDVFAGPAKPNLVIITTPAGYGEQFCRDYFCTAYPTIITNPVSTAKTLY